MFEKKSSDFVEVKQWIFHYISEEQTNHFNINKRQEKNKIN